MRDYKLNNWLPFSKDNPIPDPENERQILCIYNPKQDTNESRSYGSTPFIKIDVRYFADSPDDVKNNSSLFWNHQIFNKDDSGIETVYRPKYCEGRLFCIVEIPDINR